MAKRKSAAIGVAELTKYLETESDFDFELRVLHFLRTFGFECEHGGHYEDPVTRKSREFDIRLRAKHGDFHLFAAIECKNLRPDFPLLVSCVPRTPDEARHFVAEKRERWTKSHNIAGANSRYVPQEAVGKSTAQVGLTQTGDVTVSDSEVYEKWGQCLASLYGLVGKISGLPLGSLWMAVPILVVPNERLWRVCYGNDGSRIDGPEQVNQCSVYAGGFEIPCESSSVCRISHVEFMTFEGLECFCRQHLLDDKTMRSLILGNSVLEQ